MLEVYKIMNGMEGIIEAKFSRGMREEGEGIDLNSTKKGCGWILPNMLLQTGCVPLGITCLRL